MTVKSRVDGQKSPVTRKYDNPDDMLKHMKQLTDEELDSCRYPDQDSFTNPEKQTGKGMHSNELVRKVLKLNPSLFVEDSWGAPGCAAFYKTAGDEKKPTGASFRKGFMPEFTIMGTNSQNIPTVFTYGWRTVLARLLKSGDLTWPQVKRIFGDVHFGDTRGKHWNLNVREFKV